ncbi:MAG: glutamine-hydrolyzing GMP synthase [Thermoplasmata archaeon]
MFNPTIFINDAINKMKKEVNGKAIVAVSGGVDSTVAAKIAYDALKDESLAIYVDTGLMRLNETENVRAILDKLGINYKIVDGQETFLSNLKDIEDPEIKRKVIGKTFIELFEIEARKFGAKFLIQGTIAPDWIESGGGLRDTIKSHHNVGGLPEKIGIKIYEPLRDLYKDEVRKLAEFYEIPSRRQPFPGPGLAVRIMGGITRERLDLLKRATDILERGLEREGIIPWQYFVVLLSDKSTGVHGDRRVYGNTVAIRCVDSIDGMTANFTQIPWDIIAGISREITNKIPEINRVVYDITDKPPATIEWE